MIKKKQNNTLHAVFRIKPLNGTNTAVIRCIGNTDNVDEIADEPLVCNESQDPYQYDISETIHMRFFKCNLLDTYLMTTRTIPVFYASITYKTKISCGLLLNIYVDFVIEDCVETEKQLIDNTLNGKYLLRIKTNENDLPKIIELENYHSTRFMIEMIKELVETDDMKTIICGLMEERRKERIKRLGSINDVKIPKPKYNFSKLVDQYKNTGKINFD